VDGRDLMARQGGRVEPAQISGELGESDELGQAAATESQSISPAVGAQQWRMNDEWMTKEAGTKKMCMPQAGAIESTVTGPREVRFVGEKWCFEQ